MTMAMAMAMAMTMAMAFEKEAMARTIASDGGEKKRSVIQGIGSECDSEDMAYDVPV